ncbi:MAG: ATP-dependent RecD-like DNA helicase [Lachnospiraceae bacterium]|nr:ATP-dependent RecD-like DNA helicase [Lachnospiraceae bacterium]
MGSISGYIDHFIFRNEENGYSVAVLISEGKEVTCVGMLKSLSQGETIEASGEYVEHALYGMQFKIEDYHSIIPKDAEGIERYLGSGAIKGVGQALAARIVGYFGEDTLRIIDEEPERLAEIKGISPKKANEIAVSMEEKKDLREALIFLSGYGIGEALSIKIFNEYGTLLYRIIKENPYKLAEDITGVGFKTADEIAEKVGISIDADYRIRCGIFYALQNSTSEGHVFLPVDELVSRAVRLLELQENVLRPELDNLSVEGRIIIKDEKAYLPFFYHTEIKAAAKLSELNINMGTENPETEKRLRAHIEDILSKERMELEELQINAVMSAIKSGVFILSGGPGTGKTTTINTIIRYFESEGMDIVLAAPTGRAAKRMTEATGFEAKTIHRLLELNGELSDDEKGHVRFEKNEDNPLEADVVIIDEMSMVDIQVFWALLRAIPVGCRLIMAGDIHQLPSVGPGQVLRDIMESGAYPMAVLEKIFRQAGNSDIVLNAHRINNGEEIQFDKDSKDFFLIERNDVNVIYKFMVQLITEKLPKYLKVTPFDIQVLTPMRKGALGCETLNEILQRYINPSDGAKREHMHGDRLFREGDKVMQTKNNYKLAWEILGKNNILVESGEGVFNGDMGTVNFINETASIMTVEFDDGRRVTYPFSELSELELAYAITIHKSQGSEYPAVIMPLLTGPRLLFNRNLLYTGITRAKGLVTILGSGETVRSMAKNTEESKRYTSLKERILESAT